jgi:hypothetical protein
MRRLLARPWTEDEVMRLRQMAEAGMKTSLIARKLGCGLIKAQP